MNFIQRDLWKYIRNRNSKPHNIKILIIMGIPNLFQVTLMHTGQ